MQNRVVDLFFRMVKEYSPSGHEDNIADFLLGELDKYAAAKRDSFGNIYARIDGVGPPIFLSAHMDNVEPCDNIKPSIRNGKICSNGTTILGADNKAALAAMINMVQTIKESREKHRPTELIITRLEEIGNYGAINFNCNLLEAKEGFCFDSVSKIGTIILSSPAYERFDISLIGRAAHASDPSAANNPTKGFSQVQREIKTGIISKNLLANIGVVRIGSARNTVPGMVEIEGELRSICQNDLKLYKLRLNDVLKRASKKFRLTHTLKIVRENEGYMLFEHEPIVDYAIKSTMSINVKPYIKKSWAVSDANIFNAKGLRCVNLGDGVVNPHTTREYIRVSDLMRMEQLMQKLVSGR